MLALLSHEEASYLIASSGNLDENNSHPTAAPD